MVGRLRAFNEEKDATMHSHGITNGAATGHMATDIGQTCNGAEAVHAAQAGVPRAVAISKPRRLVGSPILRSRQRSSLATDALGSAEDAL